MPQLQDFQFFHQDRLNELYEKEQAFELHKHSLAGREAAARAQVHCPLILPFTDPLALGGLPFEFMKDCCCWTPYNTVEYCITPMAASGEQCLSAANVVIYLHVF